MAVFVFLWQGSIYFAQKLLTFAIGIIAIATIQYLFNIYWRGRLFHSYFRKRPGAANLYFLATEWANFALSAGFVTVRMLKLLAVSALSVGRVDSPFLAPGVGDFSFVSFDPMPSIHLRCVIAQEAHRHPYVEAAGTLFLMKLHHGDSVLTRAGVVWRLLFVHALMPWMAKYRKAGGLCGDEMAKSNKNISRTGSFIAGNLSEKSPCTIAGRSSSINAPHCSEAQVTKSEQNLRDQWEAERRELKAKIRELRKDVKRLKAKVRTEKPTPEGDLSVLSSPSE